MNDCRELFWEADRNERPICVNRLVGKVSFGQDDFPNANHFLRPHNPANPFSNPLPITNVWPRPALVAPFANNQITVSSRKVKDGSSKEVSLPFLYFRQLTLKLSYLDVAKCDTLR